MSETVRHPPGFLEDFRKTSRGKIFPRHKIFLEEISPGELSGIYRNKTLVYSRKIVFFWHVNSLWFQLWQVRRGTEKFPKSFPEVSGNIRDNFWIKLCKHLFPAGKLYFLFIKFYNIFPKIFRNVPLSEKISEIYQNCQKYFPGDFSLEEISPGELSGIYRNKTRVYSRKIVFFWDVNSL